MSHWQEIETAPKDGTHIDIWASGFRYTNAWWHEKGKSGLEDDAPPAFASGWYVPDERGGSFPDNVDDPTHWMPIPDPPTLTVTATQDGVLALGMKIIAPGIPRIHEQVLTDASAGTGMYLQFTEIEKGQSFIELHPIGTHVKLESLKVMENLLSELQKVLDAVPVCPLHGECVPHAIGWITAAKGQFDKLNCRNTRLKNRCQDLAEQLFQARQVITANALVQAELNKKIEALRGDLKAERSRG
jgi:hypothetical protein